MTALAAAVVIALASPVVLSSSAQAKTPSTFSNCTALQKYYPHGLGRSSARDHVSGSSKPVTNFYKSTTRYNTAIKARSSLDRDKDYVACEKH